MDMEKENTKGDPREYKVTAQGSLGLLALGAVGIRKWREAVELAQQNKENEGDSSSEESTTNNQDDEQKAG
jgi:hypothetical protein